MQNLRDNFRRARDRHPRTVEEKIAIREQGSLIGNIKSAGISIDDGAYFKGSIDIMRPEPKVTTKPVKNEPKIEAQAS